MGNVFEVSLIGKFVIRLLPFIPGTMLMLVAIILGSLLLGGVFSAIRIYGVPVLSQMVRVFISFSRGTPILTQLFIFYYGVPQILKSVGIDITRVEGLHFVVATYSLYYGSANAENIRSSVSSVGKGQYDAAYSIGMTTFTALRRIVVPQALRVFIPNVANLYLRALKNTSLAFSVGVVDLMSKGKILGQYSMHFFEAYLALSIIYYLLYLAFNFVFTALEKKVALS
ncbi:MAG: amino acid ABC transporter permease [Synergistaceae bacterium]|jgi:L-cystine transport system permease protein|nr:amino acid ABC transporter permease [Synergistaceae bacterium]